MGAASTGASSVADATLNVVPSIDLLVCLICFLLAVTTWTSLSRIPTDQVLPKRCTSCSDAEPPPKPQLQIGIGDHGLRVRLLHADPLLATPVDIPTLGAQVLCQRGEAARCASRDETYVRHDLDRLGAELGRLATASSAGAATRVLVAADDDVPYLAVIGVLDAVLRVCPGGASAGCLSNPSIGDPALLARD